MDKIYEKETVLKTDLLVIGGSGSASNAAVAAAQNGIGVLVVSKGKLGKSGNAIISTSNLSIDGETAYELGEKKAEKSLTKEKLFNTIVKASFYLNEQPLVQYFVEQCGKIVHEFLSIGRELKRPIRFRPPSGWITSSSTIGTIIARQIKKNPSIRVLEDTIVVDLLKSNNRVNGALAINVFTGEFYVIHAKAVILACGGFQPYSFKCTTNDSTGDGMAMALRAGAKLADMEFQLFLPGVALSPPQLRGSIYPFVWFAAHLVSPEVKNSVGKNILQEIDPKILDLGENSRLWKLIHFYYWSNEIYNGKSSEKGGLFLDFSRVKRIAYLKSLLKMNLLLKLLYKNRWQFRGENIEPFHELIKKGEPWEVGITSEYCMGGILIDNNMKTTLEGLYACGEVCSGLYGAFRVESGLTEMLVQGHKAGIEASGFVKQADDPKIDKAYIDHLKADLLELSGNSQSHRQSNPYNVYQLLGELEKTADSGLGLIRNEEKITQALKLAREIREQKLRRTQLHSVTLKYNAELLNLIKLRNMSLCLEAGLVSALNRKESRGTHLREEYQQVDNENFLFRNLISLTDGKIVLSRKSPDTSILAPVNDKFLNIPDYLRKEFL